jgi:broad specificity phosphatase PhoE
MTDLVQARPRYRWPHPAERETTLYLVRHGRTKGNVDHTLCGRLDVPLDDLGLLQAQRVADRIAREIEADALLSSPLTRARQTAGFIADRTGLRAEIIDDLAEWNFGDYEGKTLAEVQAAAPHVLKALENIEDDEAGWPGGEIRREFHARVASVFRQIAGDYHSRSVVVVAHGGVLGSLAAQIHGKQPNDWAAYNFQNCSLTHVAFSAEGVDVVMINDVAHLAELFETENGG